MRLYRTFLVAVLVVTGTVVARPESAFGVAEAASKSVAWAINNRGEVAGELTTSAGQRRAIVWDRDHSPHELGTFGGDSSAALGINDLGELVGVSDTADGSSHAFLWSSARGMTDLGTLPGTTECVAVDINERGAAVGYCDTPPGYHRHAVLWSGGRAVDLGDGEAHAVNDRGDVLATCVNSFGYLRAGHGAETCREGTLLGSQPLQVQHGRLGDLNDAGEVVATQPGETGWTKGTLWTSEGGGYQERDLGTLGGTVTDVWDVNERGEAVGSSSTAGGLSSHAYLWVDGAMTDLGTLGGSYSTAYGINDRGAVVGSAAVAGNASGHAFVWYRGTMTDLGT